jgi:hypothetical protein
MSRVNSPNPRSPRIHALNMISMGMYGVDQDEGKECIVIPPRSLLHLPRGCGPHVRTSSRDVITLYFRVALVKYKGNMIGNLRSTRQSAMSSQRGALGGQVKRVRRGDQTTNSLRGRRHICVIHINTIWVDEEVDPAAGPATPPPPTARGIVREVTNDRRPLPITVTLCT